MFLQGRGEWSKHKVTWELLARRLGGKDFSEQGAPPKLREQATRLFGSYAAALAASCFGLEEGKRRYRLKSIEPRKKRTRTLRGPRRQWSSEEVIRELRDRAQNKQELAQGKVGNPLLHAALRYFGTYANAVEAAGLEYESIRKRPARWSREDVIGKLRNLDAAGVKLNYSRVKEKAYGIVPAIRREFGTIKRALKEAGVAYYPRKKWSRRKILSALLKLHREGKSLSL